MDGIEAFTNPATTEQFIDDQCYDKFYAKVYDPLVQPIARAPMETKMALEWFNGNDTAGPKKSLDTLRIADIGCGTGIHVELFLQQGVQSVVGFDKSKAMIAEAHSRFPDHTSHFIVGDASVPTMTTAGQYDLITMFYFTVYMVPERTQLLRNVYLWLDMGGYFLVHIVNKHKMDPVLESASPFVGFSIQKYADERITKSQVEFDKFSYTGDFNLHGSRATYEEIFQFKDGRTRRHEQRLWMPDIKVMVEEIESVGFKMKHYVDLVALGYEYQYLFFFEK